MKIKFSETYFWLKFSSRTQIFGCFLDLFEEKSSSKSKKHPKILVRDENFDQKYGSNFVIFIFLFCVYFPSTRTTSFSPQLHPPR